MENLPGKRLFELYAQIEDNEEKLQIQRLILLIK